MKSGAAADNVPLALLLPLIMAAQPVATDSYLPALPAIRAELGNASASLTVFVLAMGIGQLGSGPLSDRFGRRPVLLADLALYALAAVGAVLAVNFSVRVVARALLVEHVGWRSVFVRVATANCARATRRSNGKDRSSHQNRSKMTRIRENRRFYKPNLRNALVYWSLTAT